MSSRTKRPRHRVHARISVDTHARLQQYCAMRRTSACAVVETALREHLDGSADPTLIMRRLDRLGRAQERLQRDLDLLMESFGAFMKFWFAHTPPVEAASRSAAKALSEERYEQFMGYVADQYSGGHRFVHDLPEEVVTEPGELAEAATQGPAPDSARRVP